MHYFHKLSLASGGFAPRPHAMALSMDSAAGGLRPQAQTSNLPWHDTLSRRRISDSMSLQLTVVCPVLSLVAEVSCVNVIMLCSIYATSVSYFSLLILHGYY